MESWGRKRLRWLKQGKLREEEEGVAEELEKKSKRKNKNGQEGGKEEFRRYVRELKWIEKKSLVTLASSQQKHLVSWLKLPFTVSFTFPSSLQQ